MTIKSFSEEGGRISSPRLPKTIKERLPKPHRTYLSTAIVRKFKLFGGYSVGVTPVPIPNTEVKPYRADDTAWEAMWESRSPPKFIEKCPLGSRLKGHFVWKKLLTVRRDLPYKPHLLRGSLERERVAAVERKTAIEQ